MIRKMTLALAAIALLAGMGLGSSAMTTDLDTPTVQKAQLGCPGLALPSPFAGAIAAEQFEDVLCLSGINAGDVVSFRADTTDPVTTSDLWAAVCTGTTYPSGCVFGDDNFGCTFPPPAYSCPARTFTATSSGPFFLIVGSWGVWGGAAPGGYRYSADVTVNGNAASLDVFALSQAESGP